MDKLKNNYETLFHYKNLYDREKELIRFFKFSNTMNNEIFNKFQESFETLNKEIKDISIFENIRNKDIVKFNILKAERDIKLQKIITNKELRLLKINVDSNKKKSNIENNSINCFYI